MVKRVSLAVGAVALVVAVVLAIVLRGWEFGSWVSAVIGALSIAVSQWPHRMNSEEQPVADRIEQANIEAGRDVIVKRGGDGRSHDQITQSGIRAGRDVIAKKARRSDNAR